MRQARALLDSLRGGGRTAQPGAVWDRASPQARGAIAGGLLGVLMSGPARRLIGSGAKVGLASLIGSVAYKAYADWQAGQGTGGGATEGTAGRGSMALSQPAFEVDDDFAERLLQAMVAAAKADGHVTPDERLTIDAQLARLGLQAEAQALIAAELDSALDVGRIAALARNEAEAVEIYTASLLVVDAAGAAEKGYLAMLAARLGLEPDLVAHVHAQVG